jgi:hypothetical protein
MFSFGRRGADLLAVALAVAGIGLLTAVWAATIGKDATAATDRDELVGEVIPVEATPQDRRGRGGEPPSFVEDFENGLRQWRKIGSAATTDLTAAEGRRSVTLTSTACREDAFTRPIPVEPGSTYRLSTDYRTEGDGGYVGLTLYAADGSELGEQWLIGDGAFPTYDDVRWRYNVDSRDPGDLGSWSRYTTTYVIPRRVASVAVKIEDWGCGGLPDDPSSAPVYLDHIVWAPAPGRPQG